MDYTKRNESAIDNKKTPSPMGDGVQRNFGFSSRDVVQQHVHEYSRMFPD